MIHRAPWRARLAEFLGTALLVTAVVGSGVMASRLSPRDVGVQLLENSIATAFALGVLILIFGPVSGAHFNPVVSAADWFLGRRTRTGLTGRDLAGYAAAQTTGAIAGSILANLMFALPAVDFSGTDRAAGHLWLGEIVATAGLILLIFALALSGRAPAAPAAVGAYIGAAYWFTSSTSFANPAVTVGRAFTDTFAGIAPASVPGFVVAQVGGAVLAVGLLAMLYPRCRARGRRRRSRARDRHGLCRPSRRGERRRQASGDWPIRADWSRRRPRCPATAAAHPVSWPPSHRAGAAGHTTYDRPLITLDDLQWIDRTRSACSLELTHAPCLPVACGGRGSVPSSPDASSDGRAGLRRAVAGPPFLATRPRWFYVCRTAGVGRRMSRAVLAAVHVQAVTTPRKRVSAAARPPLMAQARPTKNSTPLVRP